ncbi:hypothetical protein AgCh_007992 [Apium graveolens]
MVRRLEIGEQLSEITLNELYMWVQIYDLPVGFNSEYILKSIGNHIGRYLKSDAKNFQSTWRQFLRIKVALKVHKPLKVQMRIKKQGGDWMWVKFKYERLPSFCFYCGIIGHSEKFCEALYDNAGSTEKGKYDASIRAPMRNQITGGRNQWLRNAEGGKLGWTTTEEGGEEDSMIGANGKRLSTKSGIGSKAGEKEGMVTESVNVGNVKDKTGEKNKEINLFSTMERENKSMEVGNSGLLLLDPKRRRTEELNTNRPRNPISPGDAEMLDTQIDKGLGLPWKVRFLADLVRQERPVIIFLCETLSSKDKMEFIRCKLGFDGLFVVESQGRSGGLAMLWKEQDQAKVISYSQNHIDVEVRVEGLGLWRLTGFYGEPNRNQRSRTWNLLRNLSRDSNLPWCVIAEVVENWCDNLFELERLSVRQSIRARKTIKMN